MASRLNWRGPQVLAKVERSARDGVNATMAAAVLHAKANHGPGARSRQRFQTRTGELERSIRITQPAKTTRKRTFGRWGSKGVNYARRQELGFQGKDAAGRVVNAPAYPFLRPAAEAEYPKLAGRIRRAFA